jgi:hypothetical protein
MMKFGFVLDKESLIQHSTLGARNYASVLDAAFGQLARYTWNGALGRQDP